MTRLLLFLVTVLGGLVAQAETVTVPETVVVRGHIIDEQGRPVENAIVAPFWSANGRGLRSDGEPFDLKDEQEVRSYWGNEGQMAVRAQTRARAVTDADGRFRIEVSSSYHTLFVIDQKRRKGAIASIPPAPGKAIPEMTLQLGKLVRVSGRFTGGTSGKTPKWTHVYIKVPSDPFWPLSSCKVVSCGSFESRFEVLLPPGKYQLHAGGQSSVTGEDVDFELKEPYSIIVKSGRDNLNVGSIPLSLTPASPTDLAKQAGRFTETEKLIGKKAPAWRISDARGMDKSTRIEDLRGKWVLLYFWDFSCQPCVGNEIPKLIAFHDRVASTNRPLTIISFYIDWGDEIANMSELEKKMQPFLRRVWKRPSLPFPVLLDESRTTFERFGIAASGTSVLIDPTGKVVGGGIDEFEAILAREAEQSNRSKP